jgi:hypothetical protein
VAARGARSAAADAGGRISQKHVIQALTKGIDNIDLIRYASTFVLLPNMFDQVAVALLLLAGITFVYVIGIRQSNPHEEVHKEGRRDGTR